MTVAKCPEPEFISLFTTLGAAETARQIGSTERKVYERRSNIEKRTGRPISSPSRQQALSNYPDSLKLNIQNGTAIIGSDAHIWPGPESTAQRAFKKLCDDIRPEVVILNGDVLDFPQISRHPPINWEKTPSPIEEIEAAQDYLSDLVKVSTRRARKIWTLGNHDARFEMRLATIASEYKGIKGIHLSDHFTGWEKGWSCAINSDVVVKHRFKGGKHAPYNNAVYSGVTMVTGHLHSQKVEPHTDYNGDRYGVDTGCLAAPMHRAFTYTEANPLDWRSGFAVLTFRDGRLMQPELVSVWSDKAVQFRGQLVKV